MFAECGSWTESIKPDKIDVEYELKFISSLLSNNKNNPKLMCYYFNSINDFIKDLELDVENTRFDKYKKEELLNQLKCLEEEFNQDKNRFIVNEPKFKNIGDLNDVLRVKSQEMIYASSESIEKPFLYNFVVKYNLYYLKPLFFVYNDKMKQKNKKLDKLYLEIHNVNLKIDEINEEVENFSNSYLDEKKLVINQLKSKLKDLEEKNLNNEKIIKIKTYRIIEHVINKTIELNKSNIYDLIGSKEDNDNGFNKHNVVAYVVSSFITNFEMDENKKLFLKGSVNDINVEFTLKDKINKQIEEIKSINIEEYRTGKIENKELKKFKV